MTGATAGVGLTAGGHRGNEVRDEIGVRADPARSRSPPAVATVLALVDPPRSASDHPVLPEHYLISSRTRSQPLLEGLAEQIYDQLRDQYCVGEPVPVDFRALVPSVASSARATHQIHPYPAKLLRHIPALFTAAPQLSDVGARVLDPFCGSGTVLVEAQLAGRRATGVDANPFACLLARVKTRPLDRARLQRVLAQVLKRARHSNPAAVELPARLHYWYLEHIEHDLRRLRVALDEISEPPVRDVMAVCLSATARATSLADPRVAVPVRLRPERYPSDHPLRATMTKRLKAIARSQPLDVFSRLAHGMFDRIDEWQLDTPPVVVHDADVRDLPLLDQDRFDFVVTSPPYLGAQKYVRASSLALMWLGDVPDGRLQPLCETSIGRDQFRDDDVHDPQPTGLPGADAVIADCQSSNPLRAHMAATYLHEMRQALGAVHAKLRPSGRLVLVAGPNQLVGRPFDTPAFLVQIAQELGFSTELALVDTIRSRGLMTRRNHSAAVIDAETVTVLVRNAE